ncbi:RNA polymerase sigma factor [Actinomadura roseirufa]|uniref:RNA polymerase sigma factor n=1 Tax=Actinomadura roseirufa TaxID=2094049 RepID=UPI001040E806|nr:sigma-70 family RNA polymerase sigma factor [Actinomadura roseirufa]
MDDHLLVEALRDRDPGAPATVYGAYADRLYAYCWFRLRDRDAAQAALRDAFVVAEAHIGRLRDKRRFGPWLYALARLECGRRQSARVRPPDPPVDGHAQEDADQRIVAWQAVLALPSRSREILELRVRHRLAVPDLAAVLDLGPKEAQAALDRAHGELEESLTAEILAHQGPYGCDERARLLRERSAGQGTDLGGRLAGHAGECDVCGALRPRTVSAAKVYGLLPDVVPPPELRLRVMSCFMDPELVGYRLFVATRVTEFAPTGFPIQSRREQSPSRPSRPGRRPSVSRTVRGTRDAAERAGFQIQAARVAAVLALVSLLFGVGVVSVYKLFDLGHRRVETAGIFAGPRPTASPGVSQMPLPGRPNGGRPEGKGAMGVAPVSATFPLGARESSTPPIALSSSPSGSVSSTVPAAGAQAPAPSKVTGTLTVSPGFLDLAGGSDGSVELRADGGPVTWRARSWGAVRLSQSSGRVEQGRTVTVGVHIVRYAHSRGEGGIAFQPGAVQVRVTWRPNAPAPDPTPTQAPTGGGDSASSTPTDTQRPGKPPVSSAARPRPPYLPVPAPGGGADPVQPVHAPGLPSASGAGPGAALGRPASAG